MKVADSVKRAGRSLKNAKGRTILTSLAIAVGAFTLTLSLAAGEGARQYADKLITSNIDPQSIFIAKDPTLFGGGVPGSGGLKEYSTNATQYAGATFKALNQSELDNVKNHSNITKVFPMYLVNAQYITFEGVNKKFTTDVTAYDSSVRSEVSAGKFPPLGTQIADNGAIIPEAYLKSLGKNIKAKDMIGKTITLHLVKPMKQPTEQEIQEALMSGGTAALETKFAPVTKDETVRIVAVSAPSSTALSTSSGVFISENKAKSLSEFLTQGTDQYQKFITATATVKDGVSPETVKKSLEKQGLIVRTAKDLQSLLFTIVNILQGIVIGFGIIALIASVFGIINTQYISVLERTREIGLMKALGMRGRDVSRLFQLEAAWIGLLGGVLGAALAWLVGTLLNPTLSKALSIGENSILIYQLTPIVLLIILLIIIAMLAGWFPARKAAKLDPIEALRTE